jgi:hypothetical protein
MPCASIRTGQYVPSCTCDKADHLEFVGLNSYYHRLTDVQATARNIGDVNLYIDPIQAGIPVLFRWNEAHKTWDEVETWRCSNVGLGTKRVVARRGSLLLKPGDAGALYELGKKPVVELFDGTVLPSHGRYRLGLRYSTQVWHTLADQPSPPEDPICKLQLSSPFEVK